MAYSNTRTHYRFACVLVDFHYNVPNLFAGTIWLVVYHFSRQFGELNSVNSPIHCGVASEDSVEDSAEEFTESNKLCWIKAIISKLQNWFSKNIDDLNDWSHFTASIVGIAFLKSPLWLQTVRCWRAKSKIWIFKVQTNHQRGRPLHQNLERKSLCRLHWNLFQTLTLAHLFLLRVSTPWCLQIRSKWLGDMLSSERSKFNPDSRFREWISIMRIDIHWMSFREASYLNDHERRVCRLFLECQKVSGRSSASRIKRKPVSIDSHQIHPKVGRTLKALFHRFGCCFKTTIPYVEA